MRRHRLVLLSSLSLAAALLASTAAQAVAPPALNLGLFKPQDKWKVGTVNAGGAAYCAMMNRFDKDVTLAFARSPDGYGSVAMDFRDRFFKPGSEYAVTLQVDDAAAQSFIGRASSDHALVVQVGRNDGFYEQLSGDGNMEVRLPTMNMTFALRKFSNVYPTLVDCAGQLQAEGPQVAAMPVTKVDKSALPAEKDQDAGRDRPKAADSTAPIPLQPAPPSSPSPSSASAEDGIRWGEGAAARAGAEADYQIKLSQAQSEQERLKQQFDTILAANAILRPAKEKAEAELAVTRGQMITLGREKDDLAAKLDAQDKQARLLQAALAAKEQELQSARDASEENARRLVEVRAELASLKVDHASAVDKLQAQLKEKTAQYDSLQRQFGDQNAKLASDFSVKSEEAERLAKKLADAETERKAMIDKTSRLQAALSEKQDQLSAVQLERDNLKQRLVATLADSATIQPAKEKAETDMLALKTRNSELDAQLAAARQQQEDLAAKLSALERQNKILQASLEAKQSDLVAANGDRRTLDAVRAELDNVKSGSAAELQKLQEQLKQKAAQYDALQRQYDEEGGKTEAYLSAKRGEMERLESQLAEAERQNRILQTALQARGLSLSSAAGDDADLGGSRDDMARMQAEYAASLQKLQAQLREKTAQYEALRQSIEKGGKSAAAGRAGAGREARDLAPIDPVDRLEAEAARIAEARAEAMEKKNARRAADAARPVPGAAKSAGGKEGDVLGVAAVEPQAGDKYVPAAPPSLDFARAAGVVSLRDLLQQAGIGLDSYVLVEQTAESTVSQWVAGRISGMYEKSPARSDFDSQARAYLNRYREDCGDGALQVRVSPAEKIKAGIMALAEVQCLAPANTYVSTFLFLRDGQSFSTILHAAYPSDRDEAQRIRDRAADALRRVSGLVGPEASARQSASLAPRQRITPVSSAGAAAYAGPTDDLATVIVQ